jgi:hypothetical protein
MRIDKSPAARIFLFCLLCLSAFATHTLAQQVPSKVRIINNEIFVEDRSGKLQRLTGDGRPKENAQLSPGGSKVFFHYREGAFGTSSAKEILCTVLEIPTGREIARIKINWEARFISRVNWLGEQRVWIEGEGGFLTVLDIPSRKQLFNLYGTHFKASPDHLKIILRRGRIPRYGEILPAFDSDSAELLVIGKAANKPWSVYPSLMPPGRVEPKRYSDLNERHFFISEFAWASDSRRVAFVENQSSRTWLVVLTFGFKPSDVQVDSKRYLLPARMGEIHSLKWQEAGDRIRVAGSEQEKLVLLQK